MNLKQTHRACTLALIVLATSHAQAQSNWTMTRLSAPIGVSFDLYGPNALDAQGNALGFGSYQAVWSLFGRAGMPFNTSPTDYAKQLTWAKSTSAAVSPSVGVKGFIPVFVNTAGSQVGRASSDKVNMQTRAVPLLPRDLDRNDGTLVLRKGGTNTPCPSASMKATGVNNLDEVVGHDIAPALSSATGQNYRNRAVVWQGSAITPMQMPSDEFIDSHAYGINDAGMVAGSIGRMERFDYADGSGSTMTLVNYPAIWQKGQIVWHGAQSDAPTDLRYAMAVAVNQSGQVIIERAKGPGALWVNGQITNLSATPNDRQFQPLTINDNGLISACVTDASAPYNEPGRPVLWKQGVITDLRQDTAAKGIKIPTGSKLYCPTALNNKGDILTFYAANTSTARAKTLVWVRLSPKP